MKCVGLLFVLALGAAPTGLAIDSTPISRVVQLITSLKEGVEKDGEAEGRSYDKYACWCEETLARKVSDISSGKDEIERLQTLIVKLKGELGSHGADIAQLNKDIAANEESVKEATQLREKEAAEYNEEKTESEQCIGALEAAVTVLSGAGEGKGFLETLHEAQLLSVISGVRQVLRRPTISNMTSEENLDVVRQFVSNPDASLALVQQKGSNPFGEYAPKSGQVQGILKGMYDAFTGDLEKSNVEEAEKNKGFKELMATKDMERATLQDTLRKTEADQADKTKQLADSKTSLDDAKEQLDADEEFFKSAKASCQDKAAAWSVRTRMRTEELQGMAKAVEILDGPEARALFENAHHGRNDTYNSSDNSSDNGTFFLQVGKVSLHQHTRVATREVRNKAYSGLRSLATRFQSLALAKVAAAVKSEGAFDKVMAAIDEMIATLRKEEQDDIEHRDRCQGGENKNTNDLEDLNADITKVGKDITRMGTESTNLGTKITTEETNIKATEDSMKDALDDRNGEEKDYINALKDDHDSIKLIKKAIVSLSKYYKDNNIPLELVQKKTDPEYTEDPDKAPETNFDTEDKRKNESGGIVAILSMIAEDLEKEMKTGRAEDAEAQEDYLKNKAAMQETLDAQTKAKNALEVEKAELDQKITDYEEWKTEKEDDKTGELSKKAALATDCTWVKDHFDSRRTKRKAEIDGLIDAKGFLAGGGDPLGDF